MVDRIEGYLKSNSKLIKSLFLMYVIGAVTGVIFALLPGDETKNELKSYIVGFLELYQTQEANIGSFVWESFINYIKPIFVIWVLGASLVGSPMIFVMPVVRGFVSLFSMMFLALNFGYDGLWFSLGTIVSIEFLFIPALILYCVYAVKFSLTMFKIKSGRKYGKRLARYSGVMLAFVALVALISVCESYLFTYLLPIFMG